MNMISHSFRPDKRGYHAAYREGDTNHCPGCGRSHWIIGRTTAECSFCGTALVLVDGCNTRDADPVFVRNGKGGGHVR